MRTPEVTVVGEALVDIVRSDRGSVESPGGSPANVALTLGRLGRRVALVTRLGDDERGGHVREWLAASGVQVIADPSPRTSTATATLDATGAAQYAFDLEWDGPAAALPIAPIVHTGSIATLRAPGAERVHRAIAALPADTLRSYDPNIRPSLIEDPELARALVADSVSASHLVKASTEDLDWLFPGADPQEIARAWVDDGADLVVVTAGAEGAFATYRDGVVGVPAPFVRVVDTVGAGDTVMGTLLDSLTTWAVSTSPRTVLADLDAEAIERLLERALAAAAVTVSRPGADPPWSGESGS